MGLDLIKNLGIDLDLVRKLVIGLCMIALITTGTSAIIAGLNKNWETLAAWVVAFIGFLSYVLLFLSIYK